MNGSDVTDFYQTLEKLEIDVWVDGGWGVDALLGVQTRPHNDLDIAIQQDIKIEHAKPWNFVLGDRKGHEIDVHAIVLDKEGNGLYGPPGKGIMYPAGSLTGTGMIAGHKVRCISLEWVVKFHTGL